MAAEQEKLLEHFPGLIVQGVSSDSPVDDYIQRVKEDSKARDAVNKIPYESEWWSDPQFDVFAL